MARISTYLPNNPIHKRLLQPGNLRLKRLHLTPAIQRLPIIHPQTRNNPIPRLLHALMQRRQLPAPLEFTPQRVDLAAHRLARDRPVDGAVFRRRRRRGRVFAPGEGDPRGVEVEGAGGVGDGGRGRWFCGGGGGRLRDIVFNFAESLLDLGEGLLLAGAQAG